VFDVSNRRYGLAQRWPSVTSGSFPTCLAQARDLLLSCKPNREGRGLEAVCFMGYLTYSFTHNQLPAV
jgi:hypothetical protein